MSFGNLYIYNPDLVEKFTKGIIPVGARETNLKKHFGKYFYSQGPVGYTDVSVYEDIEREYL